MTTNLNRGWDCQCKLVLSEVRTVHVRISVRLVSQPYFQVGGALDTRLGWGHTTSIMDIDSQR